MTHFRGVWKLLNDTLPWMIESVTSATSVLNLKYKTLCKTIVPMIGTDGRYHGQTDNTIVNGDLRQDEDFGMKMKDTKSYFGRCTYTQVY